MQAMQFQEYGGGRKLEFIFPGQNGRHFADIFKCFLLYENVKIRFKFRWNMMSEASPDRFRKWRAEAR